MASLLPVVAVGVLVFVPPVGAVAFARVVGLGLLAAHRDVSNFDGTFLNALAGTLKAKPVDESAAESPA